jgi:hypothetical protein
MEHDDIDLPRAGLAKRLRSDEGGGVSLDFEKFLDCPVLSKFQLLPSPKFHTAVGGASISELENRGSNMHVESGFHLPIRQGRDGEGKHFFAARGRHEAWVACTRRLACPISAEGGRPMFV